MATFATPPIANAMPTIPRWSPPSSPRLGASESPNGLQPSRSPSQSNAFYNRLINDPILQLVADIGKQQRRPSYNQRIYYQNRNTDSVHHHRTTPKDQDAERNSSAQVRGRNVARTMQVQEEARSRLVSERRFRSTGEVPLTPSGTDDEVTYLESDDEGEGEAEIEQDAITFFAPLESLDHSSISRPTGSEVKDTGESSGSA